MHCVCLPLNVFLNVCMYPVPRACLTVVLLSIFAHTTLSAENGLWPLCPCRYMCTHTRTHRVTLQTSFYALKVKCHLLHESLLYARIILCISLIAFGTYLPTLRLTDGLPGSFCTHHRVWHETVVALSPTFLIFLFPANFVDFDKSDRPPVLHPILYFQHSAWWAPPVVGRPMEARNPGQ